MIRMFNKLPQTITINKTRYFINTDFRLMLNYEKKVRTSKNDNDMINKVFEILKSFCPTFFRNKHKNIDRDIKILLKKFLWFYQCGGRKNYHKTSGNQNNVMNEIYSYEYDDEYIWSAFYQYFNIDLSTDKLHWWKYKAIFKSLPEECKFEKIKRYRAYNGKDKDRKKLKEYWKLPLDTELQKELDKTTEKLLKYSKKEE